MTLCYNVQSASGEQADGGPGGEGKSRSVTSDQRIYGRHSPTPEESRTGHPLDEQRIYGRETPNLISDQRIYERKSPTPVQSGFIPSHDQRIHGRSDCASTSAQTGDKRQCPTPQASSMAKETSANEQHDQTIYGVPTSGSIVDGNTYGSIATGGNQQPNDPSMSLALQNEPDIPSARANSGQSREEEVQIYGGYNHRADEWEWASRG